MLTFEYDEGSVAKDGRLFPIALSDDLWIAYHGTSSIFEQDIDKTGLHWNTNIGSKEDVKYIVNIFKRMSWCGNHQGGFAVLSAFSLNHDFANADAKPIFLAESSLRALTFATHDFAGGETARALRHCFEDLHQYLISPKLREQHIGALWRQAKSTIAIPIPQSLENLSDTNVRNEHFRALWAYYLERGVPSEALGAPPQETDLVWLQNELTHHADLEKRCATAHAGHEFGLVYAVKFSEADLALLDYHPTMGLKAHLPISAEKLVAKVRVPKNCRAYDGQDDYRIRALTSDGLFGRCGARITR